MALQMSDNVLATLFDQLEVHERQKFASTLRETHPALRHNAVVLENLYYHYEIHVTDSPGKLQTFFNSLASAYPQNQQVRIGHLVRSLVVRFDGPVFQFPSPDFAEIVDLGRPARRDRRPVIDRHVLSRSQRKMKDYFLNVHRLDTMTRENKPERTKKIARTKLEKCLELFPNLLDLEFRIKDDEMWDVYPFDWSSVLLRQLWDIPVNMTFRRSQPHNQQRQRQLRAHSYNQRRSNGLRKLSLFFTMDGAINAPLLDDFLLNDDDNIRHMVRNLRDLTLQFHHINCVHNVTAQPFIDIGQANLANPQPLQRNYPHPHMVMLIKLLEMAAPRLRALTIGGWNMLVNQDIKVQFPLYRFWAPSGTNALQSLSLYRVSISRVQLLNYFRSAFTSNLRNLVLDTCLLVGGLQESGYWGEILQDIHALTINNPALASVRFYYPMVMCSRRPSQLAQDDPNHEHGAPHSNNSSHTRFWDVYGASPHHLNAHLTLPFRNYTWDTDENEEDPIVYPCDLH